MVTKSPFPDVEIPEFDIWTFLFERNDRNFPEHKKIYVDAETSRSYDYGQVKETAVRFGKFLKSEWAWKKGDVLALYTPNSIDTPAVLWGCHWAGGIITTANPAYTPAELTWQLKNSGAKAIVTQAEYLTSAVEAAREAGIAKEKIILIDDKTDAWPHRFDQICHAPGPANVSRESVRPCDLAFLVYSSGTTGRPKGVKLSHRNIVSNVLMLQHESGKIALDNSEGVMITFLPVFHIYGLVRLLHDPIYYGITAVIMKRFEIQAFCASVQRHRATFAHVVPPVLLLLVKHPVVSNYDLSSLQMMSSGAAPLTWDLARAVYERIGVPVKQAYGLTETSPTTHSQEWSDWSKYPGSVGRLLPNQTVKYLTPGGDEVPPGSTGEICILGPNVFQGYWRNAQATAQALTSDGFFKTGDIGYQDTEGNLYITDRAKELIKYKGFQVAPAELEGLLTSHPKVVDAAVIGLWRKSEATEVPRAYIVPSPKAWPKDKTEQEKLATELVNWISERVAPHKRLRGGIRFIDAVPKNASGKVLRRILRDRAEADDARQDDDGRVKSRL